MGTAAGNGRKGQVVDHTTNVKSTAERNPLDFSLGVYQEPGSHHIERRSMQAHTNTRRDRDEKTPLPMMVISTPKS